jgi:hypothetical protein
VGSANLEYFFNLLQLDGYNPLILNPIKFLIPPDLMGRPDVVNSDEAKKQFLELRKGPVLAGQIYDYIQHFASDPLNAPQIFKETIRACTPQVVVQHGEGYWTDHWTYNLDHLDQFLAIYPEKKGWILFEKNDFTYYDSDHFVRPRREKYTVLPGGPLRQYQAVVQNEQKKQLIESRTHDAHLVRIENGQGEILRTSLFVKLLNLLAIKISSLDPYGVGLEMDADKPGWCDALNGLPGLFGSSSHEMFELHRLVRFMKNEAIPAAPHKTIEVPTEIYSFIREIEVAFQDHNSKDFRPVWDKLATAREEFRERVFFGVSGKTRTLRLHEMDRILGRMDVILSGAEQRAFDPKTGMPTSYFTYSVELSDLGTGWRQYLPKLNWKQHRLAPFLEGAVHALKGAPPAKARQIYKAVLRSELFDKKLKMYKLNVPLDNEPSEIGRIRIFSAGWLENEAIFLHMHYKYLLEILRSGMHDLFSVEMKRGLIPFQNPQVYGRSVYENSSFIASSSFPDKDFHGKGFVARLSGATSEFISMVYYLFVGGRPFHLMEDGFAVFQPEPCIPIEWFTSKDEDGLPKHSAQIRMFGVPVTFTNPSRRTVGGPSGVKPISFEWILDGRFHNHTGRSLPAEASLAFREGRLESLTIHLGKGGKK